MSDWCNDGNEVEIVPKEFQKKYMIHVGCLNDDVTYIIDESWCI